jgi:hypothetical protein
MISVHEKRFYLTIADAERLSEMGTLLNGLSFSWRLRHIVRMSYLDRTDVKATV